MRGRRRIEAECAAQPRHRELHEPRRQRPAFGADEERPIGGQLEWAQRDIVEDKLRHRRDQRHHALLAALAGHGQHVAAVELRAAYSERLGDAQPAAIE